MFMQNNNSLVSTQTDIDTILTIVEENFRIFQEILEQILKKSKPEYAVLT
jgi:hypothetical protein